MSTITNKWIEKERKKKAPDTAPSYSQSHYDILDSTGKPIKRHTFAARGSYVRTLRGVRK